MKSPQLLEHWFKTTDWLLDKCDRFPKSTRFTIGNRIAALSIEILELLTQASYVALKKILLIQVNLRLEQLRLLLRLCFMRKYLSMAQYEFIQSEINIAGRMCGGWIKVCKE